MSRRSDRSARPDPVALRSPALCRFFAGVMARQMRGAFNAIRIARPGLPQLPREGPVMVVSNHPSWWDPAFFMVLMPRLFPGREGYGPMEADMLERYGFMRRIGVFGVDRDPRRGAADFLRPAEAIMARPSSVLWITAQGTFSDVRARPLTLRGGAAHLMARAPALTALPLALEYPFWTEKRPEALALFGAPITAHQGEAPGEIGARLARGLAAAMERLADLSTARDAAAFRPLLDGRGGVGGVWQAWEGVRGAVTGRRYGPRHMEEER